MSASALLSDLPWWRLYRAWKILGVTRFRHPDHPKLPTGTQDPYDPSPVPVRPPVSIAKMNNRLRGMGHSWWEGWIIDPWIRRIEPLAFAYLNPHFRQTMKQVGLVAKLDRECQRRTWPEYAVTGSNISAVSAGKAAWALLRQATDGPEWAAKKYERANNRTHWYLDRAFSTKGVPHEGIMYGLFGLKPVGVLSHVQNLTGQPTVGSAFPKVRNAFPTYIQMSAVNVGDFHHHGDSKTVDMDGTYLSWRFHSLGDRKAGQALRVIGSENARPGHYHELYGRGERSPLPQPSIWPPYDRAVHLHCDEVNQVIWKDPRVPMMHVVDGGGGFPQHRLHLGVKPGSHSHWRAGEWKVKDDGYTNPTNRWREYDPSVWSAPADARLLEVADLKLYHDGPSVTVTTDRWRATFPLHK